MHRKPGPGKLADGRAHGTRSQRRRPGSEISRADCSRENQEGAGTGLFQPPSGRGAIRPTEDDRGWLRVGPPEELNYPNGPYRPLWFNCCKRMDWIIRVVSPCARITAAHLNRARGYHCLSARNDVRPYGSVKRASGKRCNRPVRSFRSGTKAQTYNPTINQAAMHTDKAPNAKFGALCVTTS